MTTKTKKLLTHAGIVVLMFAVACIYFAPILQGKALPQGDLQKYEGMAKAQKDYHNATGEYANWCPSMFSGMPGYQITRSPQHSLFTPINDVLTLKFMGMQNDIGVLFLYLLGFYIALLAFGCSSWLALLGALAFGLGSYNIIIIEAGHITKAWALAMMAPILGSMVMIFRSWNHEKQCFDRCRLIGGSLLFALALGCQIALNHIQITYYTALTGLVIGIVYGIYSIKDKWFKRFLCCVGLLAAGCVLALACNTRHLLVNEEYARYTMRGGSEIASDEAAGEGGLSIDYAFSWSYGVGETYTLMVPGAMGGGSIEPVSKESASYQNFHQEEMPLYWGNQPFTSGPVYFGAIIVWLFLLGLIVVKGPERWWLLVATLIAILLSWGKNLPGLNGFLFDNLPMYNKFRTPSMALVIANVTMVIGTVLGLKEMLTPAKDESARKKRLTALYVSTGIMGGIVLIGIILSGGFSYSGIADEQMAGAYGAQWSNIQSVFIRDRKALFMHDSWRSLIFILLAAVALWLSVKGKLKKNGWVIAVIAVLVVFDLWGVDRRYLNEGKYVRNARQLQLVPDQWDYEIDQIAAQYGDADYRVLNLAVNTFNDSKPSAFHDQIGGYSAAKLRRYQDLIDYYISRKIEPHVLNMLNARYIVLNNGQVQRNPEALGNCWFVDGITYATTAQEEISMLGDTDPATTAIVNSQEFGTLEMGARDSNAVIALQHDTPRNPDKKVYHSKSATDQLAVFSEIYYAPDWKAYIDGKPAEYLRADYVLRAMLIPAGEHEIVFQNEAPTLHKLDTITLIASIVTLGVLALALCFLFKKKES